MEMVINMKIYKETKFLKETSNPLNETSLLIEQVVYLI